MVDLNLLPPVGLNIAFTGTCVCSDLLLMQQEQYRPEMADAIKLREKYLEKVKENRKNGYANHCQMIPWPLGLLLHTLF